MTNPFLGKYNSIHRSAYQGALRPPIYFDLDTWHKTITGVDFAESINNLPAKFLPRVADFVSANIDYVDTGIKLNGNSFDITLSDQKESGKSMAMVQGNSANRTGLLWNTDDMIYAFISTGGGLVYGVTTAITNFDFKEFNIVYDGTATGNANRLKLYINDVYTAFDSFVGTIPASITASATNLRIGEGYDTAQYTTGIISYAKSVGQFEYHLKGMGDYEYDISGNNNHGTWSGTGTRYDYDENGSTYPNTNGYSLWQLAANPDIQPPFDINGAALALTAGVNIPAGYTKTRDVQAGGTKWNMADTLLDFDPDVGTDAKVDMFDRSNATIQTATSRASLFYDAGFPYRYQINEIADPRIYDTFFEAAYQDRVFGKVLLSGTDLIRYDEQLNYATQKTGSDLISVQNYCKIASIYP